ncbi:hypothetical protein PspS35_24805 [Pseudomonas sp. S35]|nr:hypothetical protein PspS35_24805 [Pseudomonas sp. S35]
MLHQKSRNQQLIHEIAQLKRHRFAKRSESFSPDQASLLDDLIETDLAAIEAELEILAPKPAQAPVRQQPKRTALPAEFARMLIHHEPENTQCQCGCTLKRIGEDIPTLPKSAAWPTPAASSMTCTSPAKACLPSKHCGTSQPYMKLNAKSAMWNRTSDDEYVRKSSASDGRVSHAWMSAQREGVHEGLGIIKALDYSLKRWPALSRYLDDGTVPIDNVRCL